MNGNGKVDAMAGPANEILHEGHYYPFGLEMIGPWSESDNPDVFDNRFNGKERMQRYGLNYHDFGARWYDAEISRWLSVDPLADEPEQVDKSPYTAFWNNPIKYDDPDGRCPSCLIGALIGAAVEYGGQVAANVYEGKDLNESFTDIDVGDVLISAGEGFLTSGTSAVRSVVGKAVVTVGAEVVRNTVDIKKDDVKVNDAKSVVRNTAVGLTTTGVTAAIPRPKVKVKSEVTQKQAVKAAREAGPVNRAGRQEIEKKAKATLKEAKAINKTVGGAGTSTATGATAESTKRKLDKTYGNGN